MLLELGTASTFSGSRRSCLFGGFLFLAALFSQLRSSFLRDFGLPGVLSLLVSFPIHIRDFRLFDQKIRFVGPSGFVVGIVLDGGLGFFQPTRHTMLNSVVILLLFRFLV